MWLLASSPSFTQPEAHQPTLGNVAGPPCTACGRQENCCNAGGSWWTTCGDKDQLDKGEQGILHTWQEGYTACKALQKEANAAEDANAPPEAAPPKKTRPVPPGEWSEIDKLRSLYRYGKPSNNLTEVGLMIHAFDGTEMGWPSGDVWHPCTEGWCEGASNFWSASIISWKHSRAKAFGDAGIVFAPNLNAHMCSHWSDFGSITSGCGRSLSDGWKGYPYPPEHLKDMLTRSFNMESLRYEYNEVLVDTKKFVQNLPGSVAAFIFGMEIKGNGADAAGEAGAAADEAPPAPVSSCCKPADPNSCVSVSPASTDAWCVSTCANTCSPDMCACDADAINASAIQREREAALATEKGTPSMGVDQAMVIAAYVHFLDTYNLTEKDVPLLQLHHSGHGYALTDESASARNFLEEQPYQDLLESWNAKYPELKDHPERVPAMKRAAAKAAAEAAAAAAATTERPSSPPNRTQSGGSRPPV